MILPSVYDINICGEMGQFKPYVVPGDRFTRPSPYTSHTFQLDCTQPLAQLAYARWRICWTATRGIGTVRLYACSPDASGPVVPLAYFNSNDMHNPGGGNVSNDATNLMVAHYARPANGDTASVSVSLPDLIARGVFQNIGWDLSGDNTNPITVFTSRLELGWVIPNTPASQEQLRK